MGQVTIYLDAETEKKMLKIIRKRRISKSKWIADLIREKATTTWPAPVASLAGAWEDLPDSEEIRGKMGTDALREKI